VKSSTYTERFERIVSFIAAGVHALSDRSIARDYTTIEHINQVKLNFVTSSSTLPFPISLSVSATSGNLPR
jgi:hypothetical protein